MQGEVEISLSLYKTNGWQKKRARLLREQPLCVFCLKEGKTTAATVADHVIPHKGNADSFWNGELQALCKPCHDSIKQRIEHGEDVIVVGLDGWNIMHHKGL